MKTKLFLVAVILLEIFLLSGAGISHAEGNTPETISPSVVTVAFAHSYNGTTNVQGAAFNLKGADAAIDLDGGVAFCFDTSVGHMPQGSEYKFLGLAQDYSGEWNVDNAYKCIMAAENIINKPEYSKLTSSMKLFAVQVAVRKQQAFGPYTGVQATAPADVVCDARQSQLMIDLTNEIVNAGLSGDWRLPSKTQNIELMKTGGRKYEGDYYILAEYAVKNAAGSATSVRLGPQTSQYVEAVVTDGGSVSVRIPRNKMKDTVSWYINVIGRVQLKTLLLFSPASSGYQRMVSLQSYSAEAVGAVSGSETFYGLTIDKKDAETGGLLTAGQAVFKIKSESEGRYIAINGSAEIATVDGKITIPDILPEGKYTIEEITAPEGYKVGESVTVSVPQTAHVDVENYPLKGRVAVTKTGSSYAGVEILASDYGEIRRPVFENRPLEGVKFEIKNSSGVTVGEIITDANGQAISDELPLGTYYVRETETLPGYILETKLYKTELTPKNLNCTVEVYNDYRSVSLVIQKQAEVWNTLEDNIILSRETSLIPGEGFVFGLYSDKDELVDIGVTDENGRLEFHIKLPLGLYYIRELASRDGYLKDSNQYGVDFTTKTEIFLHIDNYLEAYPVSIGKMDIAKQSPLAGAIIEIYDCEERLLYREVTGEDGYLPNIRLAPGKYFLKEILAPEGYAIHTAKMNFTVSIDGTVEGDTEIKDEPVCFQGTKYDTYGTPLPGAEFTLYNEAGEVVEKTVSDEKGEFWFQYFPRGKYTVRETKAPDGYYLSEDTFSFENNGTWVNGDFYTSHIWTDDEIPAAVPTPVPTAVPTPRPKIPAPNTGENNGYMLFTVTASLAIMGIISLIVVMRKEE